MIADSRSTGRDSTRNICRLEPKSIICQAKTVTEATLPRRGNLLLALGATSVRLCFCPSQWVGRTSCLSSLAFRIVFSGPASRPFQNSTPCLQVIARTVRVADRFPRTASKLTTALRSNDLAQLITLNLLSVFCLGQLSINQLANHSSVDFNSVAFLDNVFQSSGN